MVSDHCFTVVQSLYYRRNTQQAGKKLGDSKKEYY